MFLSVVVTRRLYGVIHTLPELRLGRMTKWDSLVSARFHGLAKRAGFWYSSNMRQENNYAFIDSQNVHKGVRRDLGWKLDWSRFRVYLRHKYNIVHAYLFIGFIPEHNDIYDELQKAGFILKFKPVLPKGRDGVKGNVDADLVLQTMIDYPNYDKAIIVSSDGDFYSLARYLYDNKKLLAVLSPTREKCSSLLRKSAKDKMVYMDKLDNKLAKRKSTA